MTADSPPLVAKIIGLTAFAVALVVFAERTDPLREIVIVLAAALIGLTAARIYWAALRHRQQPSQQLPALPKETER